MSGQARQTERGSLGCSEPDFACGACGSVVIAVWRRDTTVSAVNALAGFIAECAAAHPEGVALLQIIEETATPPSGTARRALARMHDEHARAIRRSALVFTKRGFAGAAVRAVMTGVAMLHPPAFEHQLFASVREAVPWIEEVLGKGDGGYSSSALLAVVEALRASARRPPTALSGTIRKRVPPQ